MREAIAIHIAPEGKESYALQPDSSRTQSVHE